MGTKKKPEHRPLSIKAALSFRAQLRAARDIIVANAEGFDEALTTIESVGAFLTNDPRGEGLGAYRRAIVELAERSDLIDDRPSFEGLFDVVKDARNDLMHEGVAARRTAAQAVSIALILEDALAIKGALMFVEHYMVEGPMCAELWQTLKLVRRTMLSRQFSYLPIRVASGSGWKLLADRNL